MPLELKNISKTYGPVALYRDFSLAFDEGKITCILGPSGCGKTTLLNLIGGLVAPDSGTLDGFTGKRISYIFQDPRLLPGKPPAKTSTSYCPMTCLPQKECTWSTTSSNW